MAVLTFSARASLPGGFTLDADFDTSAQVTALFGPSGSGKTSVVPNETARTRTRGTV